MKNFKFNTVSSTSDLALSLAKEHSEWVSVCSEEQSSGRGKNASVWSSPKGNIYLSIAFPYNGPLEEIFHYCILANLTIGRMLEKEHCRDYYYKWPNDIYIGNKKISGVLVELFNEPNDMPYDGIATHSKQTKNFVVVGIGINMNISPISTSTCMSEVKNIIYNEQEIYDNTNFLINNFVNLNEINSKYGFDHVSREWIDRCIQIKDKLNTKLDVNFISSIK